MTYDPQRMANTIILARLHAQDQIDREHRRFMKTLITIISIILGGATIVALSWKATH